MTKENLTFESPTHFTESCEGGDHSHTSSVAGRWPKAVDSFHVETTALFVPLLGVCLVIACFVASNLYLRRKPTTAKERRRNSGRSQVDRAKLTEEEGSLSRLMNDISSLQLAVVPYWILRKCVASYEEAPVEPLVCSRNDDGVSNNMSKWSSPERAQTPAASKMSLVEAQREGSSRQIQDQENGQSSVPRGAPRHVAVIMDGHRRYGRAKYGDPLKGHSDGGKKLGKFLSWCIEAGVEMVTAFAFSTENWKRDEIEVLTLMDLVCKACAELMEDAVKQNMRIRVLSSDKAKLPERVLKAVQTAEHETRDCSGFLFNICLSYGARQEIANACRKIAGEVTRGALPLHMVDEEAVERNLLTGGLPDPDVLIRSSGEKRVSNFLLFQMAYTELFFINKLWPEVTQNDILNIFEEYKGRQRRFGS